MDAEEEYSEEFEGSERGEIVWDEYSDNHDLALEDFESKPAREFFSPRKVTKGLTS